jgi:hypothetical protein
VKRGDLVQLNPEFIEPGEPHTGIYWSDEVPLEDWGDQVAFECDCLVYWNEDIIPFQKEFLVLLRENETR